MFVFLTLSADHITKGPDKNTTKTQFCVLQLYNIMVLTIILVNVLSRARQYNFNSNKNKSIWTMPSDMDQVSWYTFIRARKKTLLIPVTSLPFIKTISLQTCRCLLFFSGHSINNKSCYFHFKNHKQLLFSKLVFHVKVDTKHREGGVMFLLNQPNSF